MAQHGDLGFFTPLGHGCRHHGGHTGGDAAGVVMLQETDPVKAHFLGEFALLHAFLVALYRCLGVVVARGDRPGGGKGVPLRIPHGAEIGCFHHVSPL